MDDSGLDVVRSNRSVRLLAANDGEAMTPCPSTGLMRGDEVEVVVEAVVPLVPVSRSVDIALLVVLLALTNGEKAGTILGEVICEPCEECLLEAGFGTVVTPFIACRAGEAEEDVATDTLPLP